MTDPEMIRFAEQLGCSFSDEIMQVATKRAPNMGVLLHALALAWAARVAVYNFDQALTGEPGEQEARDHLRRLIGLVNASADTAVALAHARAAQREVPVG